MNILVDGQTLETPEANRGIGVYFKNILGAMMENNNNNWYISISNSKYLEQLDSTVLRKIIPIIREDFDPKYILEEKYIVQERYTETLKSEINKHSIDAYFIPNPLMINVLFPLNKLPCPTIVTIHDLIPIVFREVYIKCWQNYIKEEYLRRLKDISEWVDGVIFDSKSSQNDFYKYVKKGDFKDGIIYLGVSKRFEFLRKYTKNKYPYILYTGGFDYRKNMDNALKAFADLVYSNNEDEVVKQLKFMVVCSYSEKVKKEYEDLAKSLGILDRLVLTGYVSDSKLEELYKNCEVFFFPSIYEGFGLPALEAMFSGAVTVMSKTSSLPEIGNKYAFYCDPHDVKDMATVLLRALRCVNNTALIKEQVDYAAQFSWEKSGHKTLSFMMDIIS